MPGAERALEAVLRQPLIGLTYAEERQIHVRSAVIYGSQDPTMSAAGARSTAARLRTDVVVAIPGAAHLPMLSAPATLATEVERFVRPSARRVSGRTEPQALAEAGRVRLVGRAAGLSDRQEPDEETIAATSASVTGPVPRPRPRRLDGTPSQSANDAPTGRVRT